MSEVVCFKYRPVMRTVVIHLCKLPVWLSQAAVKHGRADG